MAHRHRIAARKPSDERSLAMRSSVMMRLKTSVIVPSLLFVLPFHSRMPAHDVAGDR
jgi:hypothetical protein